MPQGRPHRLCGRQNKTEGNTGQAPHRSLLLISNTVFRETTGCRTEHFPELTTCPFSITQGQISSLTPSEPVVISIS